MDAKQKSAVIEIYRDLSNRLRHFKGSQKAYGEERVGGMGYMLQLLESAAYELDARTSKRSTGLGFNVEKEALLADWADAIEADAYVNRQAALQREAR